MPMNRYIPYRIRGSLCVSPGYDLEYLAMNMVLPVAPVGLVGSAALRRGTEPQQPAHEAKTDMLDAS